MRKKIKKRIVRGIFKTLYLIFTIIFIASICISTFLYFNLKEDISINIQDAYKKVEEVTKETFNNKYSTQILDKDGNILQEFKSSNYKYATYEEINPKVFDTFITMEDIRFYKHKGIDYKGIVRALTTVVKSKLFDKGSIHGGSTITQQLSKNVFLTQDFSVWRKLQEVVIAQEIEKKFNKQEILEFYVNNIYFGYGNYGIETAANYYFQKSTKELNISEIATLVGITNNPTLYDPISNYDKAKHKRNIILQELYKAEKITKEDFEKYKNEEIELNVSKEKTDNSIKEYHINYAVDKSIEEIMKINGFQIRYSFKTNEEKEKYKEKYTKEYDRARQEFLSGGYKVETSIDTDIQDILQDSIDEYMSRFTKINSKNDLYMKQAAGTIIDNKTGEVVAISGGRTQEGNTFNRAVYGARQPGSVLKPIISYAPAYEIGYTPTSVLEDKKIKNGPLNWYSGFKGEIDLRYATEISNNTIPYQLTAEIGTNNALRYLTNMNFKYIDPERDITPIVSVGGFTYGVTTTEIASAFSTLSRNGNFIEPTNVKKISKRATNKIIYENARINKRVYEEGAAFATTDTLKGVLSESHGTGNKVKMNNFVNQAGKTGSTDNSKDLWFSGYTKHYTSSIWIGDDIPAAQKGMSGGDSAGVIWKNVMEQIHRDKEDLAFDIPSSIRYEDGEMLILNDKKNNKMMDRYKKEEERKNKEALAQQERLGEEEYRIVYGLSEEEENSRELKAELSINKLRSISVYASSQHQEIKDLMAETSLVIEDVKRKSAYFKYLNLFKQETTRLTAELDAIYEKELSDIENENTNTNTGTENTENTDTSNTENTGTGNTENTGTGNTNTE